MTATASSVPVWDIETIQTPLPAHVLTGSMRYCDFESIGRGGKAEVSRCRDQNLGRHVAYKVLHTELMDSELEQLLLVREARIMAALDHAAIPQIHDLGRDYQSRPYFTMTLVSGVTLREILDSFSVGSRWDAIDLLTVLVKTSKVLSYAHEHGVAHCDVKPENVIVDNSGNVFLVDWGLAAILDHVSECDAAMYEEFGRQGSPLYMSPEQITGDGYPGRGTDIYSLGVVLYECLYGEVPFQGRDVHGTLQLVLEEEPIPPPRGSMWDTITPELENVCLRALAKTPYCRWESMQAFSAALTDCHLDLLMSYDRELAMV